LCISLGLGWTEKRCLGKNIHLADYRNPEWSFHLCRYHYSLLLGRETGVSEEYARVICKDILGNPGTERVIDVFPGILVTLMKETS
jgi:hypothetical protein